MQPIVATYKDKNGADFTNPGYLTPTHLMPVRSVEENPASWKPIGTVTDYLLSKAISLITGLPYQGPVILDANTYVRSVYGSSKTTRLYSDMDNRLKNSVHFAPPKEKELRQELINQIKNGQILK